MINLRCNKGITLMAEAITVVLLMMIIGVISYSSMASLQVKALNNMYSDIVNIQEKAANYYLKYGEAPVDKTVQVQTANLPTGEINPNDEENSYYKVDISKLLNLSLNNNQTNDNYYYMNTKTLTTYYTKGVKIDNLNGEAPSKTYHTLPENHENVAKMQVSSYQN